MLFKKSRLDGACLIEPSPMLDERGFFMRTFCMVEFARAGLQTAFVQHNTSYTKRKGTIRGMHLQRAPHAEVKVVTCLRGAIQDVIIDLRPDSPTFCKWESFELTAANRRQLYIPEGFAHGFQTLTDDVEVGYLISEFYAPQAATGVRYDDPAFRIKWALPAEVISRKDTEWPPFVRPRKKRTAKAAVAAPAKARRRPAGKAAGDVVAATPGRAGKRGPRKPR